MTSVVLRMGPYPFAFPRDLMVETSTDGRTWMTAWRGGTARAAVHAALANASDVPILIEIPPVPTHFIRLRQRGSDPTVPWMIAELSVHGS